MPDKDGDLDITTLRADQIIRVADADMPLDGELAYTTISHWYDRQDLFAAVPCAEDVTQHSIGDCFLLAGVLAILGIDPSLIYRMMRDRRGGWVVVRLYAPRGDPIYYEVQKTYVTKGGQSLQRHRGWWVHILEKAYAAHRLRVGGHTVTRPAWVQDRRTGEWVQREGARRPAVTFIDGLSGGQPHDALRILLGGMGVKIALQPENKKSDPMVNLGLLVVSRDPTQTAPSLAFRAIFPGCVAKAQRKFERGFSSEKVRAFERFQFGDKIFRQEQLLEFFSTNYPDLGPAVFLSLKNYICKYFPGKRGTGFYTLEQHRLYNKIQEMLTKRYFVVVGTGTNVGRNRGEIAATDERKVKGLAGPHAYHVVGLSQMRDSEVRFLRLRNPWLDYVRNYKWKEVQGQVLQVLSAEAVDNNPPLNAISLNASITFGPGEFLLELSELTKRFIAVYFATGHDDILPDLGKLQSLVVA